MSLPQLIFTPWIPLWALAALAAGGLILTALAARGTGTRPWWRLLPLAILLLALANPRLTEQEVQELNDIALVMVDDSGSMNIGNRHTQAEEALQGVLDRLKRLSGLEVRVEHYHPPPGRDEGTQLMQAINRALVDVPHSRLAGTIMITDGEVHDVPAKPETAAPYHALIVGSKTERDRRLVIDESPAFGIVGKTAKLTFHIEDPGFDGDATVTIRRDGGQPSVVSEPLNSPTALEVPLDHAGSNVIELSVNAAPNELTLANNRAAVAITGVRDRLRVLLISGEPHAGERVWRNLLKADPSVDLVHFTILRPPEKEDATPLRDLALIAFPVRELFEEKLKDFDLIILDRFRRRAVLPPLYYANIANYVKNGGALLVAAGPEFSGSESLYSTALRDVLSAAPTGEDYEHPYRPMLTELGKRHPVTANLPGSNTDPPHWGQWMRVVGSTLKGPGTVLMTGPDAAPLLVLDHVGDGRVAEMLTDTAWLWSRGYDGGGPQAELLRRLAHWMMKEPELEEEQLTAELNGDTLSIQRRSLTPGGVQVTVTAPDGKEHKVTLADQGDGRTTAHLTVDQDGLWRVSDGQHVALAAAGSLAPIEMAELRATADKLAPLVKTSGGGLHWVEDGLPDIRRVEPDSNAAGSSWIGMRANHDHLVTALRDAPLIPAPLLLFLGIGSLVWAWWREGR
ncbi:MAG TPA: hypothetical protein VGG27_21025 [Magnetospirillaceae bacterium]|jgi:hypothetical protein